MDNPTGLQIKPERMLILLDFIMHAQLEMPNGEALSLKRVLTNKSWELA
jgi:hypothetical protein